MYRNEGNLGGLQWKDYIDKVTQTTSLKDIIASSNLRLCLHLRQITNLDRVNSVKNSKFKILSVYFIYYTNILRKKNAFFEGYKIFLFLTNY